MLAWMNVMFPYPGTYPKGEYSIQEAAAVATVTYINAVLKYHNGWLVASVFASSVLLACCLTTALLRLWTANLQLALTFSSLMRDNVYVFGSGSGTYLVGSVGQSPIHEES